MASIPHTIFIIPYRDRANDKLLFEEFFQKLKLHKGWSDVDVRLAYAHQCDSRLFNRGAMKNIGFLAMQREYQDTWKDITFVFHDIDSIPVSPDLFKYETTKGIVTHYYGFDYTLGGMFAIKGADFVATGGFPNLWGWGLEDNVMQNRVIDAGLTIDRSEFLTVYDKRVKKSYDGHKRRISNRETAMYKYGEKLDKMSDITSLVFECLNEYVNITNFETPRALEQNELDTYDPRETGSEIRVKAGYFRRVWKMGF